VVQNFVSVWQRAKQLFRSLLAGGAATGADLATLTLLVAVVHLSARAASIPALLTGALVNFIGNRQYAFRQTAGPVGRQVAGYAIVETVALGLNALLYDETLRILPASVRVFWVVRLCTSNLVFLGWSYPLWKRVFHGA
jgi:putative flippase GtrA